MGKITKIDFTIGLGKDGLVPAYVAKEVPNGKGAAGINCRPHSNPADYSGEVIPPTYFPKFWNFLKNLLTK